MSNNLNGRDNIEVLEDMDFGDVDSWNSSDNDFSNCESFEADLPPDNWKAYNSGEIQITTKHYKNGSKSLRWTLYNDSRLIVTNPLGLISAGKSNSGGMRAWIYSEKPIKDVLTFNLGSNSEIKASNSRYTFGFNLNFKGWRAICINFDFDAKNEAYIGDLSEDLDTMEILSPKHIDSLSLYFDLVEFTHSIPWNRTPDYQIPKARTKFNDGKGGTWDRSLYYSNRKPEIPLEETITHKQLESFNVIAQRYNDWVFGKNADLSFEPMKIRRDSIERYINFGLEKYNSLNIKVDEEGNITGIPLFSSRSPYGPKFGSDVSTKIFMPLVFDYKFNGSLESKDKLMLLFDYFYDQGWADGSGIETLDHETNRSSGYCHAVYIMNKELRETGRLDRELATLKWFTNFGKTFGEDYTESTADDVRTHFMYKLLYVLSMEDSPVKVQYMKGLIKWMNSALAIAPGYGCTIKPDYTGFHHRGVYASAYTPQAYHMAAVVIYLLHGTEFALSEESFRNVKQSLITQNIITNKYDVPIGISGRFPNKYAITNEILPAYAYMALATNTVDTEMAEIFMNLWDPETNYLKRGLFQRCGSGIVYYDTLGAIQLMQSLVSLQYSKAKDPSGYWIKPYAALAIHRRDDWMVSTKGWSQYSWDFEGGKKHENIYGRYSGYGCIQILSKGNPINTLSSGYNMKEGWDWKRWPGTTVINIPLEELKYSPKLNNHRYFSDSTFVGGVSSNSENGIFALKLHDSIYNTSFYANKTYFYFGNEIICLGSDITNDDSINNTETTLFQSFIKDEGYIIYINNTPISEVPYRYISDGNGRLSILDPYSNGYIIPDNSGVIVERKVQYSKDSSGRNNTTGLYTTAWINHGTAPKNGSYEFSIIVNCDNEELKEKCLKPTYKVYQCDKYAHILEHHKEDSIGYVIFDDKREIVHGPLKSVSQPVVLIFKRIQNGYILSLADPDLRLPKMKNQHMDEKTVWTKSEMKKVRAVVEGKWYIEENNHMRIVSEDKGFTTLEFDCVDGKTLEVEIKGK